MLASPSCHSSVHSEGLRMLKVLISYLEEAPNAVGNNFGDFIVGRLHVGGEATENAAGGRLIEKQERRADHRPENRSVQVYRSLQSGQPRCEVAHHRGDGFTRKEKERRDRNVISIVLVAGSCGSILPHERSSLIFALLVNNPKRPPTTLSSVGKVSDRLGQINGAQKFPPNFV